jgi:hypothetical protein
MAAGKQYCELFSAQAERYLTQDKERREAEAADMPAVPMTPPSGEWPKVPPNGERPPFPTQGGSRQ